MGGVVLICRNGQRSKQPTSESLAAPYYDVPVTGRLLSHSVRMLLGRSLDGGAS
jgi:hypothetical protein